VIVRPPGPWPPAWSSAWLLAAAEAWAGRCGLERLTLETGAANTAARAFYAAAGYHEEDVRLTKDLRA
jgi:GNAT superfamily N-acetyltransferase